MKLGSVGYLFKQGLRNIWVNRIMSLASFCILMVSLLLIGFTVLFIININMFIGSVENKNEVIIFLEDDVTDTQIEQMGVKLKNMPNVSESVFYSKDEAFEDLKAQMTDAEFAFTYIEDSPLPDAYRIKVRNIDDMDGTLNEINRMEGIFSVKAPNDFVNILIGMKSFVSVLSAMVMTALVVVCLVIISNTMRASVDMRRREISIMRLVGATAAFIKIPFLAEGVAMGVLAGAAAIVITGAGYSEVAKMFGADISMWSPMGISGLIPLKDIFMPMTAGYILAGAAISAAGTVMSTSKYVKV
ncbi:MAG: ABC transporter permease [Oscillospiraceae bacterium]|nr:ABC transporter permease [Oscillospiraceae bacterium]